MKLPLPQEPAHNAHLASWMLYVVARWAVLTVDSALCLLGAAILVALAPISVPVIASYWRKQSRTDHALERIYHDIVNWPKS